MLALGEKNDASVRWRWALKNRTLAAPDAWAQPAIAPPAVCDSPAEKIEHVQPPGSSSRQKLLSSPHWCVASLWKYRRASRCAFRHETAPSSWNRMWILPSGAPTSTVIWEHVLALAPAGMTTASATTAAHTASETFERHSALATACPPDRVRANV